MIRGVFDSVLAFCVGSVVKTAALVYNSTTKESFEMSQKKKPKIFRRIVLSLAVLLIAVGLILQFCLGAIVKSAAEAFAPGALGTSVKIESVKMNLVRGEFRFNGVVVGPPEGYKANVFELSDFHVQIDMKSLLSDTIVVRDVSIIRPKVAYELSGIHSNVGAIMSRLEKGAAAEKTKDTSSSSGKKFVVENFVFSDAQVKLASATIGVGVPIPLPNIELKNIGRKGGGITVLELVSQIFSSIGGGIINAASDIVLSIGGAAVDGVKVVGGVAVEGVKAVGGAAVDGAKAIGGAVMGIFKSNASEQVEDAQEQPQSNDSPLD